MEENTMLIWYNDMKFRSRSALAQAILDARVFGRVSMYDTRQKELLYADLEVGADVANLLLRLPDRRKSAGIWYPGVFSMEQDQISQFMLLSWPDRVSRIVIRDTEMTGFWDGSIVATAILMW